MIHTLQIVPSCCGYYPICFIRSVLRLLDWIVPTYNQCVDLAEDKQTLLFENFQCWMDEFTCHMALKIISAHLENNVSKKVISVYLNIGNSHVLVGQTSPIQSEVQKKIWPRV